MNVCYLKILINCVLFFQTKVENLSALDALSGDFVAPTKASGVQAALSTKQASEVKL